MVFLARRAIRWKALLVNRKEPGINTFMLNGLFTRNCFRLLGFGRHYKTVGGIDGIEGVHQEQEGNKKRQILKDKAPHE